MDDFFAHPLYKDWVGTRTRKIEQIFTKEFFKGKTILEVAAGSGDNGAVFREWGATVTFSDARWRHIDFMKWKFPDAEVLELNQEYPWDLHRRFDAIIHWGVLYHLEHWQQDLACACLHADLIFLESEVTDSEDATVEVFRSEEMASPDQSFTGKASCPSVAKIEAEINKLGFDYVRYDDADLDSHSHQYSWKAKNDGGSPGGQRRFWVLNKRS